MKPYRQGDVILLPVKQVEGHFSYQLSVVKKFRI